MVNKLSIAALFTSLVGLGLPVVTAKEFDTFNEYLKDRKKWIAERPEWTIDNARASRDKGTFWNPDRAAGLDTGIALAGPIFESSEDDDQGCAVIVYFDDVLRRFEQRRNSGEKMDKDTWIKPLAVAPLCAKKDWPKTDWDYPGPKYKDSSDSLLYHNFDYNVARDTYLVLKCVATRRRRFFLSAS
jgi:hypothetical protein